VCGSATNGRLGLGKMTPNNIVSEFQRLDWFSERQLLVKEIDVGGKHCLARLKSELYAWGSNESGQLGLGFDKEDMWEPQKIKFSEGGTNLLIRATAGYNNSAVIVAK
jgi:alpha-tubulin suppressor-like RCC1 family protein